MPNNLPRGFPPSGRVEAIYLRPGRGLSVISVSEARAVEGRGLEGDRSAKDRPIGHKRQVTLIQAEHLPVIAAFLGRSSVDAGLLRRNLVVSGLNIMAGRVLRTDQPLHLRIGANVVLAVTGPCDPCFKLEASLGPGAWHAVRGHGGLTARIEVGGAIVMGDAVALIQPGIPVEVPAR